MARRLAADEGLFAGTSTGANVIAVLRVAESLPEHEVVIGSWWRLSILAASRCRGRGMHLRHAHELPTPGNQ